MAANSSSLFTVTKESTEGSHGIALCNLNWGSVPSFLMMGKFMLHLLSPYPPFPKPSEVKKPQESRTPIIFLVILGKGSFYIFLLLAPTGEFSIPAPMKKKKKHNRSHHVFINKSACNLCTFCSRDTPLSLLSQ